MGLEADQGPSYGSASPFPSFPTSFPCPCPSPHSEFASLLCCELSSSRAFPRCLFSPSLGRLVRSCACLVHVSGSQACVLTCLCTRPTWNCKRTCVCGCLRDVRVSGWCMCVCVSVSGLHGEVHGYIQACPYILRYFQLKAVAPGGAVLWLLSSPPSSPWTPSLPQTRPSLWTEAGRIPFRLASSPGQPTPRRPSPKTMLTCPWLQAKRKPHFTT